MSNITIGDGVMYHGSMEDAHGLYVVVAEDPQLPGRFILASPEHPHPTLHHVRPVSFEVLISAALIEGEES